MCWLFRLSMLIIWRAVNIDTNCIIIFMNCIKVTQFTLIEVTFHCKFLALFLYMDNPLIIAFRLIKRILTILSRFRKLLIIVFICLIFLTQVLSVVTQLNHLVYDVIFPKALLADTWFRISVVPFILLTTVVAFPLIFCNFIFHFLLLLFFPPVQSILEFRFLDSKYINILLIF